MSASLSATPPVGIAGEALDTVRALDDLDRPRMQDIEDLAESATAALLAPPSVDAQLAMAYGVSRRFELDARVGSTGIGAGFRVQLLRVRPGIYLALGAMAHFQLADFPLNRLTDEATLKRMVRYDFSFPLSFGYSSRVVHLWAGPKLVMTRFATDFTLCIDSRAGTCRSEASIDASGRATHLAGQLGLALGKGHVWVAAEITVARVWVHGNLDLEASGTRRQRGVSRSGRIITPALGLLAWF